MNATHWIVVLLGGFDADSRLAGSGFARLDLETH